MANRTDFVGISLLPPIYMVMKEERLNAVPLPRTEKANTKELFVL